ncbi:hypothetical protein C8F04DRAFT_1124559 [Mycena alexandri]|uniref:Uncharacterized protein n=1 Tax=Mycena alexandri TaxID=1745969 RepID=A0AAD6WW07_9AGAR|nr:hypothetical protein C8F04DRAFT_1124559 [Mycena alexandri]
MYSSVLEATPAHPHLLFLPLLLSTTTCSPAIFFKIFTSMSSTAVSADLCFRRPIPLCHRFRFPASHWLHQKLLCLSRPGQVQSEALRAEASPEKGPDRQS